MMTKNRPERIIQLQMARKALTAVVLLIVMPLCGFLLSSIETTDQTITTPTPPSTTTPTPSPQLVSVEYQIEATTNSSTQITIWYTGDENGQNKRLTEWVSRKPFTETIKVHSNTPLELSGVLANEAEGELTCRILTNGVIIDQSTRYGVNVGAYCSGVALPQR